MNLDHETYQKPELTALAEQIYECKNQKQKLALALSETELHSRYIVKRKSLAMSEVAVRLVLAVLNVLFIRFLCVTVGKSPTGFTLLLAAFAFTVAEFVLIFRTIRLILTLIADKIPGLAAFLEARFDLLTFQNEKERTDRQILQIQGRIAKEEAEEQRLLEERSKLLAQKSERERALQEKDVSPDKKPQTAFRLKESDMWTDDVREMDAYYRREEQYLQTLIRQIRDQIAMCDKQIQAIEAEYVQSKHLLLVASVLYVCIAIVQSFFGGVVGTVTGILCTVFCASMIVYVQRRVSRPILLYLVEHESPLCADYVFTHNLVPVAHRKRELTSSLQKFEAELSQVQEKRKANGTV